MPIEDILLSQWLAQSVKHYSKKKKGRKVAKKKNPGGSFIPVRIANGKLQMRIPNRNPGTLATAKAIARKIGIKTNPSITSLKAKILRAKKIIRKLSHTDYTFDEIRDEIVYQTSLTRGEANKLIEKYLK